MMQLYRVEVLMHVKRGESMVCLEKAYKQADDFFRDNDYAGVDTTRETDDSWLFCPKCKETCYGVSYVCVPKNGEAPYLFSVSDEEMAEVWINAKEIKNVSPLL